VTCAASTSASTSVPCRSRAAEHETGAPSWQGGRGRRLSPQRLAFVQEEPVTVAWFAVRLSPSTFAIFDVFPNDDARQAHLAGRLGSALMERADELFAQPPSAERLDVLAPLVILAVQKRAATFLFALGVGGRPDRLVALQA
jgi:quinol monooxygenase YgiN